MIALRHNPLMSLSGQRFGPYEILSPLGAGGMGEVWRARDTRLNRSVALKVLPAALADSSALKLRLEREGKVISQLNHPHICTLYDVGHHDGHDYLVMELLEGETLAERLSRGPLPMNEVLRFGEQIADALSAAHRHGVIHRDLKPGNVMITRAGAKVLDFGLARNTITVLSDESPTEARPITREGSIVGTVQYMSPEQLQGLPLDARSDIFALGMLLYEMVTGRRAFTGTSEASIITAILAGEPEPIFTTQPLAPPALEQLVRGCLLKDPQQRVESAHDVALELGWIAQRGLAVPSSPRSRTWTPWIAAAVLAAALAGVTLVHLRGRVVPSPPVRFTIVPPPRTNIDRTAAVSPDGRRVVFRASDLEGQTRLWLRSLDTVESKPLPGTEGASFVFWSAQGNEIGFFAGGKMRRLSTSDGSIRTIYDGIQSVPGGATWNRDGVIVFSRLAEGPLYRISASGGEAVPVTHSPAAVHVWPSFLPDGRHFLYARSGGAEPSGIYAGSIDSADRKMILPFRHLYDVTPVFYSSGHLFYMRDLRLMAQRFDLRRLELHGEPMAIDEELEFSGPARTPLSVSANGTIVYRKRGSPSVAQFALVDRTGKEIRPVWDTASYSCVRFSPDGRRILFSREDLIETVWQFELERGISTRMAFEEYASHGVWMPDGRSIVYSAAADTPPNIYMRRADGSVTRLTKADQQQYAYSVSPDGRHALYTAVRAGAKFDVYAVPVTPPHTPIPLRTEAFGESDPVVSPDGRLLAYVSDEGGQWQLYVTTFPAPGAKWQVSSGPADDPRWSADGRELYFFDRAQKGLMAVKIDFADGEVRPGAPQRLFALSTPMYDVDRQGRFLVPRRSLNPNSPPLIVVSNWSPPS